MNILHPLIMAQCQLVCKQNRDLMRSCELVAVCFMERAALVHIVAANITTALRRCPWQRATENERRKLNHAVMGVHALILHKEWMICERLGLPLFSASVWYTSKYDKAQTKNLGLKAVQKKNK